MIHSIDADPAGDLVLKLGSGDEVTLIRVQSKVLGLASPVFAAMLSTRFAEGQTLEDNKGLVDSTTTINLPEDDPTAMSLLCRILHFNEDAAQRTFTPPKILMGLAVICDKYDMSKALSPWCHIWLDKPHGKDRFDLFHAAEISYGLAHHESFWKSTRDILRHAKPASLNIEHGILPDEVIGSLRIERKEIIDQLQSRFESLVSILLREQDHDTEEYQGGVQSCKHLMMLGKYIKCLYDSGFWPTSKIQIYSIVEVVFTFDSLPNLEYTSAEQCMMGGMGCSTSQDATLKGLLDIAVGDVDCKVTGLCLSCVKGGRYTEKDGNCRASLACQVDERLQGHQSAREAAP